MADVPAPSKHGASGARAVFEEVPTWGWWVMGIGGLVVVYVRYRAAAGGAATTSAGTTTTGADVTAGGTTVNAGDVVGLNNLLVQSEQANAQQFTTLQALLNQLLAGQPQPGSPSPVPGSGGGTPVVTPPIHIYPPVRPDPPPPTTGAPLFWAWVPSRGRIEVPLNYRLSEPGSSILGPVLPIQPPSPVQSGRG